MEAYHPTWLSALWGGPNSCRQRTTTYKEGTRAASTAQSTTRHCRRISLWSMWKKLSLQNRIIQPHKMAHHAEETMRTDPSYRRPNRRRRLFHRSDKLILKANLPNAAHNDFIIISRVSEPVTMASSRLYLFCGGYNYDSTSIRRPFDCLSKIIKVRVT